MKKLLGLLLMGAAMFSSCGNDHEDLYDPNAVALMKANEYAKAFVKQFGDIDPNHTWGFGSLKGRSSNTNSNEWDKKWYVPNNITSDEIAKVVAEFSTKRENVVNEKLIDVSNFWVQQVYTGNSVYSDANGNPVNDGKPASAKMDKLGAYVSTSNYYEHINNFNQGDNDNVLKKEHGGVLYAEYIGTTLVENVPLGEDPTKQFAYLNSIDNKDHTEYLILEIDGAYYLGFDFSADGYNPNEQVQRDWVFNDWILKIIPAVEISSVSRIIAEDLGNSDDFDFNDVVFDVEFVAEGAKITLQAAGGTLPLFINDNEVHEKFGVSTETMVNTGNVNKEPVSFVLPGITSLDQIEITVSDKKAGKYYLKAECGEAPQKICVPVTYQWTSERQSIEDKYPKFIDWVGNSTVNWLN